MKCKILFSRRKKNLKKNIQKCRLLKFLPSMQSVRMNTVGSMKILSVNTGSPSLESLGRVYCSLGKFSRL